MEARCTRQRLDGTTDLGSGDGKDHVDGSCCVALRWQAELLKRMEGHHDV